MSNSKLVVGVVLGASVGLLAAVVPGRSARGADNKPAAPAAAPAAAAGKCKAHNGKNCCDPAVAAHLPLAAIFSACGESEATLLGEEGSKETCKYVFKVEGQKEDDTYVQIYAPAQKGDVPSEPADPFYSYKKVGKVSMTDKAKSPKVAATIANMTGLYLPGKGYLVSVQASTKVCDKAQAKKLASSMK
jgi:hypothetical protein